MRLLPTVMVALTTLVAFAVAAPAANAAGFGPVRSLSPAAGNVDQLDVAVAPTGETAVMWRRLGPRSSMTLFAHADPAEPVFRQILGDYFDSREDEATTARLEPPTS